MKVAENDNTLELTVEDQQKDSVWREGYTAAINGDAIEADPYAETDVFRSGLWRLGFAYVQAGAAEEA